MEEIIRRLDILISRQPDELLRVSDVADILATDENRVYALINSGKLKAVKLGAKKVRRSTLNKFMADLEEGVI